MAAISKWRTSEDVQSRTGLIGPNAVLQMLPVLERLGGRERRDQILGRAGIFDIPDGSEMIPETMAARLHRQLRLEEPELAPALAAHAGTATADYILAHRIPRPAQVLLKASPPAFAARTLAKAIARHAWTFAGSGAFAVVDSMTFEVTDNPLIAGERSDECLCHWHAAVFERLYQTLVAADVMCREETCGAQNPARHCRFVLRRNKTAARLIDITASSAASQ